MTFFDAGPTASAHICLLLALQQSRAHVGCYSTPVFLDTIHV